MSMNKTRAWVAGTIVLCLLLTVAAWFLLIGPKRAEAAETRDATTAQVQANEQTRVRIAELKRQYAELPQLQAELEQIRVAMPKEAAYADVTRRLQAAADASQVTLMAITPSGPVTFAGAAPAAPPAGEVPAEGEAAPADGEAAPAEGEAAPADGEAAAPAAQPVPTSSLVEVPLNIQVVGSFTNSERFLQQLQLELGRDYLVKGLNLVAEQAASEAAGGRPALAMGDVTMDITGSVFVLPDPVAPAADPAAPVTDPAAEPVS